jgi:radical SAM protein with 4Fe4S-binding SPASM domain
MIPWINLELTNDCWGNCYFCGRNEARKAGTLEIGYMPIALVRKIAKEFKGNIAQFNRDGDALLYDNLMDVGRLFKDKIINIVTNGQLLWDRRLDIQHFISVTVSVIEDDKEQFRIIKQYQEWKDRKPLLFVKFLGTYDNPEFEKMGIKTMRRTIHNPKGDFNYQKGKPLIPEIGVCLDLLMKPSIDWQGNVHICNRYDPDNLGVIGNVKNKKLNRILGGRERQRYIEHHKKGMRHLLPLCDTCEFWGIPRVE